MEIISSRSFCQIQIRPRPAKASSRSDRYENRGEKKKKQNKKEVGEVMRDGKERKKEGVEDTSSDDEDVFHYLDDIDKGKLFAAIHPAPSPGGGGQERYKVVVISPLGSTTNREPEDES